MWNTVISAEACARALQLPTFRTFCAEALARWPPRVPLL